MYTSACSTGPGRVRKLSAKGNPNKLRFHESPFIAAILASLVDGLILAGKERRWDMISSHSSVGVVIYHTGLDALLIVRQFRPAVSFHLFRLESMRVLDVSCFLVLVMHAPAFATQKHLPAVRHCS